MFENATSMLKQWVVFVHEAFARQVREITEALVATSSVANAHLTGRPRGVAIFLADFSAPLNPQR
jgi:hypothetical protein